jgi:hypothetical protein
MADNKTTTYSHVRAFLSSRQTTSSTAGVVTGLLPSQGHVPTAVRRHAGHWAGGTPPACGQGQHIAGAVLRHGTMSQILGICA